MAANKFCMWAYPFICDTIKQNETNEKKKCCNDNSEPRCTEDSDSSNYIS